MNAYDCVALWGTAEVATNLPHHLAEGVAWDPIREMIMWVDITSGAVHSGYLRDDGSITVDRVLYIPGVAAAVAPSARGELIIAGSDRLYYLDIDLDLHAGRQLIRGEHRRFNDGKPDPAGRFVIGTKGPGEELLLLVDGDEHQRLIDDDLTLSNGLCWSVDGRLFYSVDTFRRRIYVRDYDPVTSHAGMRREFLTLTHGYPDGMTIDTEGHLWVAMWGEGCVLRISPTGEIVGRVAVPAPHTSCPAFVGPNLDTLVITTATEGMNEEQLAAYPLSGRLFTIKTGHLGISPNLWSGHAPLPVSKGNI